MSLVLKSHCKVNLQLNILRRREDGFHELETILQPVPLFDELRIERAGKGIELTCNNPRLAVDENNLVFRAASLFLKKIKFGGIRIHLQKNLPLAAGMGAGSSNAAFTLRGLNELFDKPLNVDELQEVAASLGSDIPFFLQDKPALATGRGEQIKPLGPFPALQGRGLLLIHPGFGVSTPWAYQALATTPEAYGTPGRANAMVDSLQAGKLDGFANTLEAPVFQKHLVLPILKYFLAANGALVSLMSGSGSATFAITETRSAAEALRAKYHEHFGQAGWSATVAL
ncbi:MAG: 4-(cytidine 5'-diphospho)-2-C-methyl-D-erythritol kinase [Verrucomicrobia subdivision 3 bacterium]|nr:4-(cytidine 5'-diphospho)-2-C-methyl-D-erythritol kinase [Limisphaerales bacterium]